MLGREGKLLPFGKLGYQICLKCIRVAVNNSDFAMTEIFLRDRSEKPKAVPLAQRDPAPLLDCCLPVLAQWHEERPIPHDSRPDTTT